MKAATDDLRARFRFVSPGYFATLGIPLLEGRDFTEADKKDSELVVVVSKSVAQQLFPGQDALNRHIMWTDPLIKVAGISPKRPPDRRRPGRRGRRQHPPSAQFDNLSAVRAGAAVRRVPAGAREQRSYRADPSHHENHSRRGCDSTGGARQHSGRCAHRSSGEQPRERHRVRRFRHPRAWRFRWSALRACWLFR